MNTIKHTILACALSLSTPTIAETIHIDFLATKFRIDSYSASPIATVTGAVELTYNAPTYSVSALSFSDLPFTLDDCLYEYAPSSFGGTMFILGGPVTDGPSWINLGTTDFMLVFNVMNGEINQSFFPHFHYSMNGGVWHSYDVSLSVIPSTMPLSMVEGISPVPIPGALWLFGSVLGLWWLPRWWNQA